VTIGVEEAASSRLAVPGVARDARLRTIVSAELPFFNDPAMTARLISAGLEPVRAEIPRRCRVADFGGADGYVAQAMVEYLARQDIQAHAIVVDANPQSLELAQRRGLAVVPCNLEQVKLAAVHVIVMRLVLQYNDAEAQRRILTRAFQCLAPGGFLLLQAEAGTSGSVLFRNRLARALQNAMDEPPARQCRWMSTPGLTTLVSRRGFELVLVEPEFLVFEMPLDEMLLLAWTRFHGAPVTDEARSRFASFCDYAQSLTGRMLARPGASGLRVDADGSKYFASRQTLIVARKSTGEGR
jgi:hypothetical protein